MKTDDSVVNIPQQSHHNDRTKTTIHLVSLAEPLDVSGGIWNTCMCFIREYFHKFRRWLKQAEARRDGEFVVPPFVRGEKGELMDLTERLALNRAKLVSQWADQILGTYPPETQVVWRKQKDRFANPVGVAILEAAENLFDVFLNWDDAEEVSKALDALVRIRSVQNFKPSQALSFVYLLKKVLREAYLDELAASGELRELMTLETRIDNMGLIAFDLYSQTREQIFGMRVNEVKRAQYNLLRRARMIVDSPAAGADER